MTPTSSSLIGVPVSADHDSRPTHGRGQLAGGNATSATPGAFSATRQVAKIQRIASLDELDGYESEARKRGFLPEELPALRDARLRLTPKKRKRR